ncbi:MAG: hypothetical protein K4H23_05045 [Mollicutes bacterium PWAP]|nr:hypothetical protein [Mollicutes bacterium PWAP]
MKKKDIERKLKTYKNIQGVINTKKTKILNEIIKFQSKALLKTNFFIEFSNIFYSIIEKLKLTNVFSSGNLKSNLEILVFLDSNVFDIKGRKSKIKELEKNAFMGNKVIIITDYSDDFINIKDVDIYSFDSTEEISIWTFNLFASNKYKSAKVINLKKHSNFFPIKKNLSNYQKFDNFGPTPVVLLETICFNYMDYFYNYVFTTAKIDSLKNKLVKFKGQLDNIDEETKKISSYVKKLRQNKITEDVILTFAAGSKDD